MLSSIKVHAIINYQWKFLMFKINVEPPSASPKIQKTEFRGEKLRFSPLFSLFKNRKIQRGSIITEKDSF